MCRTERLAMDESRCGMLRQMPPLAAAPLPADLRRYVALQAVADHVDCGETLEYWKSAPYPLNFMEEYELKATVDEAAADPGLRPRLAKLFQAHPDLLLDASAIAAYRAVDPGNVRLRHLMDETVGRGAWQLLWLPPTLPYHAPEGPFAGAAAGALTKRLVFSCWKVVPKAVATLLSYEVERRMILAYQRTASNTPGARKRRRPLLRFARSDGRLTGLPLLALIAPSTPWGRGAGGAATTWPRGGAAEGAGPDGAEDEEAVGDEGESRWAEHLEEARHLLRGDVRLGRPPADLARVLAQVALAAPWSTPSPATSSRPSTSTSTSCARRSGRRPRRRPRCRRRSPARS